MGKKNYTNYSKPGFTNKLKTVDEAVEEVETVDEAVEEVEVQNTVEVIQAGKVTDCLSLRIRETASSDGKVISVVNAGTELEIDLSNSEDKFYKVCSASGVEGYCMKKFITLL